MFYSPTISTLVSCGSTHFMLGVTDEWLISILSVQQCALCVVAWCLVVHVSSCCITASALHNVAVPTQARRLDHELRMLRSYVVTVKFTH